MTTNAVFLAIWGFSRGCCYQCDRKRVSGNSRNVVLLFSLSPPKPFFQKHSWFFYFLLSFLFLLSSLSTFHVFFINPFSDIILVLFLWPYEQTALKDLFREHFSYHMGLGGGTWEDGPQSAVFSACLHPEFNINLCYKRSGIDKRVVFQKGGFGGQDPWFALGLLFLVFSALSIWKNHGCLSL